MDPPYAIFIWSSHKEFINHSFHAKNFMTECMKFSTWSICICGVDLSTCMEIHETDLETPLCSACWLEVCMWFNTFLVWFEIHFRNPRQSLEDCEHSPSGGSSFGLVGPWKTLKQLQDLSRCYRIYDSYNNGLVEWYSNPFAYQKQETCVINKLYLGILL